jgi:hypothetical protein
MVQISRPLFPLGRIVATAAVAAEVPQDVITSLIDRHVTGDFGDLEQDDKDANVAALDPGNPDRILSAYHVDVGGQRRKIYVQTEWDRSYTTVMYAEEY